jgi:uncharacterized protein YgiB involved in biofilm formation
MKRSRTIRLALLGSASALALVACDEAKDPLADANFFRDPVECARNLDRAACERAFVEARDEHLRSAPAFGTREACEQAYGAANCAWQETNVSPDQVQEPRPGATPSGGGGWFMPMMMGYMLGNALGNRGAVMPGQAAAPPSPSGGAAAAARPVYRNAANEVFAGRTPLGSSRIAAAATTSRGGFGTTARSFSSSSSS